MSPIHAATATIAMAAAMGSALLVPSRTAVTKAASAVSLRGTVVWPSGATRARPFALRDQNGRTVTLRSLRGHVSVVTFMNAHCTQACPVIGRELVLTQARLGGTRSPLQVVVIDVNPAQDRASNVRIFASRLGLAGNWHWLLGSKFALAKVWRAWGIYVKWARPDILHTAALYLIDPREFVRVADAIPLRPDWLAADVRSLLASPGMKW